MASRQAGLSSRCRSSRTRTSGFVHRRQGRAQARDDRPLDRGARRRQRLEHARVERRDAVERGRDIRQQDDRIVVLLVDGHPRERSLRPRGPLSEQRRLPPARAGGQERRSGSRRALLQPADQRPARHRPSRTRGGSSFDSSSSNAGMRAESGAGRDDRSARERPDERQAPPSWLIVATKRLDIFSSSLKSRPRRRVRDADTPTRSLEPVTRTPWARGDASRAYRPPNRVRSDPIGTMNVRGAPGYVAASMCRVGDPADLRSQHLHHWREAVRKPGPGHVQDLVAPVGDDRHGKAPHLPERPRTLRK